MQKVRCPHCGYRMPLNILPKAECSGIEVRCKNNECRKIFEVKAKDGKQIR